MTARVRSLATPGNSAGSRLRSDSRTSQKIGARAGVDDDVRRRRPGDRARDDLVAWPDAGRDECEVHGRRAGRDGERVTRACVLGETSLELGRARPAGQPPGAERLRDRLDLLLVDGGGLEREKRLAHGASRGARRRPRHRPLRTVRAGRHDRPGRGRPRRESPVARTKPARSAPRRSGPNVHPGRR